MKRAIAAAVFVAGVTIFTAGVVQAGLSQPASGTVQAWGFDNKDSKNKKPKVVHHLGSHPTNRTNR